MLHSFTKIYLLSVFLLCLTVNNFPNYQNRQFLAPHRTRVGELLSGSASADFNGDGKTDAAVTDGYSSKVWILLGGGTGNLALAGEYQTGLNPQDIKTGKFNADNFTDLIVANAGENTLSVFYGNGDGTFADAQNITVGDSPSAVSIQDFNFDGRTDLAVTNSASASVSIFYGNSLDSFELRQTVSVGMNPQDIVSGNVGSPGTELEFAL